MYATNFIFILFLSYIDVCLRKAVTVPQVHGEINHYIITVHVNQMAAWNDVYV